jgi:hypothetical protein
LVATEIEVVEPSVTLALVRLTDPPTPAEAETVCDFGPPPPPQETKMVDATTPSR